MDKRIGKYAHDRKDFIRPKQYLTGTPLAPELPLEGTRAIGGGFYVVLPHGVKDEQQIAAMIASLPKAGRVKGKTTNETIADKETS